MPEYQVSTSVAGLKSIIRGSGRLYISPYQADPVWIDCGRLSGLSYDEGIEKGKYDDDNADIEEFISKIEPKLKASLSQAFDSDVIDILRGGFDEKVVVTASSQPKTMNLITTEKGVFYGFEFSNADGSKPASISVTINGTQAGLDDDYAIVKSDGRYGISFLETSTLHSGSAAIAINYTVTPLSSIAYSPGFASEMPFFRFRIVTKNEGDTFYVEGFKAQISVGNKIDYAKDKDSDNRIKYPIEATLYQDNLYNLFSNGKGKWVTIRKEYK